MSSSLRIPFLGRLGLRSYLALMLSIVLVCLETIIRLITLALPTPVINLCYRASRRAFNSLQSERGKKSRTRKKAIVTSIANAGDFVELCELFGYEAEEHIVQTGDGYLLGLHRLKGKKGEDVVRSRNWERDRRESAEGKKKVAYLHHGLMMNSEVWVCLTEKERGLPFQLAERGYDVWLGNNRGNKYSKKRINCPPTSASFWDFSIDQFAFHDIPDSIEYILQTTKQPSLSYIGFSQGTAQAFATLSIHPTLNDKIDVFIALAPAMSPAGLTSGIVDSFVKASPEVLFLAFGRKAILGSTAMWEQLLYPPIFVRLIDMSLGFLFGWTATNITPHQKLAAYPHLFSFTSVKSVVHWFQIIRTGKFQMYDDEIQSPLLLASGGRFYKVAKFPTRNIKTPIVLVYGGSDSLVDINVMLRELPKHTIAKEIPKYEHLDFLWASDVDSLVFPHVFDALARCTNREGTTKPSPERERRLSERAYHADSEDLPQDSELDQDSSSAPTSKFTKVSENTATRSQPKQFIGHHAAPSTPESSRPQSSRIPLKTLDPTPEPDTPVMTHPPKHILHRMGNGASPGDEASVQPSHADSGKSSRSRPEGWWSSDEVADTHPSSPVEMHSHPSAPRTPERGGRDSISSPTQRRLGESARRGSGGSLVSLSSDRKFGERGITLGAGRAVGGLVGGEGVGVGSGSGKKQDSPKAGEKASKRRGKRKVSGPPIP